MLPPSLWGLRRPPTYGFTPSISFACWVQSEAEQWIEIRSARYLALAHSTARRTRLTASEPEPVLRTTAGLSSVPSLWILLPRFVVTSAVSSTTSLTVPDGSVRRAFANDFSLDALLIFKDEAVNWTTHGPDPTSSCTRRRGEERRGEGKSWESVRYGHRQSHLQHTQENRDPRLPPTPTHETLSPSLRSCGSCGMMVSVLRSYRCW